MRVELVLSSTKVDLVFFSQILPNQIIYLN